MDKQCNCTYARDKCDRRNTSDALNIPLVFTFERTGYRKHAENNGKIRFFRESRQAMKQSS